MARFSRLLLALACTLSACRPASPQKDVAPSSVPAATKPEAAQDEIRLVLWVTVDQLRADIIDRFRDHWDPDGFAYLRSAGAHYSNAHFNHAITETAPGHATLFTGAPPALHGIIGNSWFDRETNSVVVSVTDPDSPLIGGGLPQDLPRDTGRSPRQLLLPTIGDAMIAATAGQAKVVSVSVKDRAAILSGGRAGKAFWLGPRGFLTSRYYYQTAPAWLEQHNEQHPIAAYRGRSWTLLAPREQYQRAERDDRPSERPLYGLGRTFPHPIDGDDESLARAVASTPFGDELTVSLALRAMTEERLGADEVPDLLAISLSSTDLIGHAYGPESLEAEDNFIRLDRQLARLLRGVDDQVGLRHTLIVLSADHGACETAEHLRDLGLPSQRIEPDDLLATAREAAEGHFGEPQLVSRFINPSLWIDRDLARQRNLDPATIASVVAEAVSKRPDVLGAYVVSALLAEFPQLRLPTSDNLDPILRSVHPDRSGDIYVVAPPYTLLLQQAAIAATHGSPWRYDTHVPLLISGPGVRKGRFERPVGPHELAPTVARLLGIIAPPGASAAPLVEILAP